MDRVRNQQLKGSAEMNTVAKVVAVIAAVIMSAFTGYTQQQADSPVEPTAKVTQQLASQPTKLMVIWEENEGSESAYAHMPYLQQLSNQFGKATHYKGSVHPSLGNYFVAATGQGRDTCGIYDPLPSACPQTGIRSVFARAIYSGKTSKVYVEGATKNCEITNQLKVDARQDWIYHDGSTERPLCKKYNVPFTGNFGNNVNSGLPNLSWIVPTIENDAHDGTLEEADAWLQNTMQNVMSGPDYQSGDLVIVITFDEANQNEPETAEVPFVVVHPSLSGAVVTKSLGHYALCKSQSTLIGVPPVANCANRNDILVEEFGLGA